MKIVQIHARTALIASSLLATSLISSTAYADLYAETYASTAGANSSGTVVVNNGVQYLREATAYTPNYYSGNDPFANAVGQATYGWITADIVRWGDGYPTASATAQWIDTLTIDSSGYTGQQGYVTASIYVSTTAYAPGGSSHVWDIVMWDATHLSGLSVLHGESYGAAPSVGSVLVSIPVTFGQTLQIVPKVREYYVAGSGPAADGGSVSMVWQGIQSVTLLDGTAIDLNGVSIASQSGMNYKVAAVPEASTWAMLLSGLGLVGWAARRRKA